MFKSDFKEYFQDFINEKKSLGYKYKISIRELTRFDIFLYLNNIDKINHNIILLYVELHPNWSQNTKARNIGTINEFLKYLKKYKVNEYIINTKSFTQIHGNYIPYIFSIEELHNIFEQADQYKSHIYLEMKYIVPLFYRLLYGTGMRIGEAINIKRKNVDLENHTIKLEDSKNGTERLVVFDDSLLKYLKLYLNKMNSKSDYLFYNSKFDKLSNSTMENIFYRLLEKANIKRTDNSPRVHDLRFTYITHSFRKQTNAFKDPMSIISILQTQVGHSSIKALEYYIKTTKIDQNNVRKLSEEKFGHLIKGVESNEEKF